METSNRQFGPVKKLKTSILQMNSSAVWQTNKHRADSKVTLIKLDSMFEMEVFTWSALIIMYFSYEKLYFNKNKAC